MPLALMLLATCVLADDFRDKVAPILESKCVRCHGDVTRKGGLALHTADALKTGGDSGAAIEPGKPDDSLLIEKVSGDKPEMPKGGKPLTPEEIATLRKWIESGASWPSGLVLKEPKREAGPWWAIQPLKKPPTPDSAGWGRNAIDGFILATLKSKGLAPSPEAERRTLIRRLTFDLHGLPPSPDEIEVYLKDHRPDAYERLVDHLLASPRYGERWGRHWLDVAHYGDTHGYDKDKPRRNAWRYRDYVINALNADMPYARFVREQIAGDVVSPEDHNALIATGFLAAGPWDFVGHVELREGTVDKEKTRLIDRDDMLANVMSTFSSLTVHCARCHNHKFDPIPQKDYYRLQAVFAGVDRGDRPFATDAAAQARLALDEKRKATAEHLQALVSKAESSSPELQQLDTNLKSLKRELTEATTPAATASSPSNGYHSSIHAEPDALAWVQLDLGKAFPIDEIRLIPARPTDFPDTPGFGFPMKFKVEVSNDPGFKERETVADESREPAQSQPDEPYVVRPKNCKTRYVRVTAARLWKRTEDYVFALGEVEVLAAGKNLAAGAEVSALDSIEAGRWSTKFLVDSFSSRAPRPEPTDPLEARRNDLIYRIHETQRERAALAEALPTPEMRTQIEADRATLSDLDRQLKGQPATEYVYTVLPRPVRTIRLLNRGDVEQPGEPISPGSLSCVPGLQSDFSSASDDGKRREALAAWITNSDNVLTWRSIVNRVWHYHFGRGIVDTPNDFGRNGTPPTHPELLDWLAVEFRDGGGSLKNLHRLIVTSATYRQSSANDSTKATIDADNRFLWRQNRRRIEAESIRDAVLAVSGQLDTKMGGPGFEPFRFKDDHSPIYDHEALDRINAPECRRRTVYRFTVRSVPNPFVECLDGADPNAMTPVRNTTITALQALTLLNDPFMIRQSDEFAKRLEKTVADPAGQVDAAIEWAFDRPARVDERNALAGYIAKHGLAKACRVLFNANEFVFVD